MNKRTWIIFSVAVVAMLGGLIFASRQDSADVSGIDHTKIRADDSNNIAIGDRVYGKKDSKVVLMEYGDFQCPGCGTLHGSLKPILEEYKDQIAFVFRNFPLTSMHPNARAAASSAEAAGQQGKYWEMHNKIYDNQHAWEMLNGTARDKKFTEYAKELKLDINAFEDAVKSKKIANKINFDQALGKANKVSATPTLFLNGKMMNSEEFDSPESIRASLKKALKEANS